MLRSSDGNFTVDSIKNKSNMVIPAADVSVINIPVKTTEFDQLVKSVENIPTDKHLVLFTSRHTKADVLRSVANLTRIKNLEFLDIVHLTYQKSSRKTGSFTHLAECGYLFYKGITPSIDNTFWFRGNSFANASNHWDVSPYSDDRMKENTDISVYPKFAWDIGLILMTLAYPLSHNKMVWSLPWDEGLISFSVNSGVKLHLITSNDDDAVLALKTYEDLLKNKKDKEIIK